MEEFDLKRDKIQFLRRRGQPAIKTEGNRFLIEAADNGTGIEDKDKKKIFTQFFVGDKARSPTGSGLGHWHWPKKIVKKMNGRIYFESHMNEGMKFIVELPYKKV